MLRIPREAAIRQVMDGLARAGFGDLRPAHFTVFQHLPPKGLRLTALAVPALLTKQLMGYLVDDLEGLGYVERAPDLTDGRAKVVRLTARGRKVDDAVRGVIRQIESDWAQRRGQENFAQLVRQLRALIAILGELRVGGVLARREGLQHSYGLTYLVRENLYLARERQHGRQMLAHEGHCASEGVSAPLPGRRPGDLLARWTAALGGRGGLCGQSVRRAL